jgi:hypothetical protein
MIVTLNSNLRRSFPSVLGLLGLTTTILYASFVFPKRAAYPTHITLIVFGTAYKLHGVPPSNCPCLPSLPAYYDAVAFPDTLNHTPIKKNSWQSYVVAYMNLAGWTRDSELNDSTNYPKCSYRALLDWV